MWKVIRNENACVIWLAADKAPCSLSSPEYLEWEALTIFTESVMLRLFQSDKQLPDISLGIQLLQQLLAYQNQVSVQVAGSVEKTYFHPCTYMFVDCHVSSTYIWSYIFDMIRMESKTNLIKKFAWY